MWKKESIRARLFKTNDAVGKNVFQTLIIKYAIYANIFVEKMWVAFAFIKATHIFFQQKYMCIRYCTY